MFNNGLKTVFAEHDDKMSSLHNVIRFIPIFKNKVKFYELKSQQGR